MYNLNNLGKKIADARKAHGLTQEQLAKALSVTAQAVSKWELGVGYPDISIIPYISEVLDIPIDRLFGYCDGFEESYKGLQFVTSFEGTACYSDKDVEAITSDGIVHFSDGSAANIRGRTVDNFGVGEIKFRTREEASVRRLDKKGEKGGEYERTFSGVESIVIEVYNTFSIRITESPTDTTVIRATGSSRFVSSLYTAVSGKVLSLSQDRALKNESSAPEDVIEIQTPGGNQTLTMILYGRTDCDVQCDFREVGIDVYSNATINCRDAGWLGLSVKGNCTFSCETADRVDISAKSNSSISVLNPRNNVNYELRGTGTLNLGEGDIEKLYVKVIGNGCLQAPELTVKNAEIHANGDFGITIGRIRRYSFESLKGNADVHVLHRGDPS